MDGCPNDSPALYPALHALTRKRKAADDPLPRPADAPTAPTVVPAHTHTQDPDPAATPRHALAQEPWPPRRQEGPSKPKRPRIDIPAPTAPTLSTPASAHTPTHTRRLRRGRPAHTAGLRFPRQPRADTAVASAVEPRTLARLTVCPPVRTALSLPASPAPPAPALDPAALALPPHTPPINRVSLRELDLEAILRNPQLRHDLLFDPGLQFRPTASRRKRAAADTYWAAVLRELTTLSACTCATFDARGRPAPRRCVCARVPLPAAPVVVPVPAGMGGGVTVRAPSRIGPLLAELREVLVSIIQPPAVPSQAAVPPQNAAQKPAQSSAPSPQNSSSSSQSQTQPQNPSQTPAAQPIQNQNHTPSSAQSQSLSQTAAHVAHLRAILDAPLLAQARAHGLLAPAPVFAALGAVVRCYCAPMRDALVERMVALARGEGLDSNDHWGEGGRDTRSGDVIDSSGRRGGWEARDSAEGGMDGVDGSGGEGSGTLGVVRAMRLCFEIMELMKLDVANHQLQTLRPYLVASAAQFELQTLQERAPTLAGTRRWLRAAWDALAAEAAAASLSAVSMNGARKEQTEGREEETVAAAWARAPRALQMQIAVTRAVVGLIFDAAPGASSSTSTPASASTATSAASSAVSTPASSVPSSPSPAHSRIPPHPRAHPHSHSHSHPHSHPRGHGHAHGHQHPHSHGACAGYPETLYLDHARLATLRTDAADFTALYMLLMLFRQLVCSSASVSSPSSPTQRRAPQRPVRQEELLAVKKEIWEIGPAHLGRCYLQPGAGGGAANNGNTNMNTNTSSNSSSTSKTSGGGETEAARWREEIASVVLQLTARAGARRAGGEMTPATTATGEAGAKAREAEALTLTDAGLLPLPDAGLLQLATGWAETNLRAEAPLSVLMRARIRRVVEETAVAQLLAAASPSSAALSSAPSSSSSAFSSTASPSPFSSSSGPLTPSSPSAPSFSATGASPSAATGLEPLMPEITHLAEKVRKLVGVHMDVYGALYAQPGFLGLGGGIGPR